MVASVIVMLDECVDLPFEVAGQVVVVEQDAVLEGLMPSSPLAGMQAKRRREAIFPCVCG